MSTKLIMAIGIVAAAALVVFATRPQGFSATAEATHLVSMPGSAQALQSAGGSMQQHGQWMLTAGQQAGDEELSSDGVHWVRDGQALSQRADWLVMNAIAPSNLVTPPSALSAQDQWGDLTRTAPMMVHDPSRARELNLEALRWNGQAMRAEGQAMGEHGRLMADQVEVMIARHGLDEQAAAELRAGVQAMQQVGGHLGQNGQGMMDYAGRMRQSMGYR